MATPGPTDTDQSGRRARSDRRVIDSAPATTNAAVKERKLLRASPDASASTTSTAPSSRAETSKRCETAASGRYTCAAATMSTVSHETREERSADHCAGQVTGLAGRCRGVQRLSGAGGGVHAAARLRQRRVCQAAAHL